MTTENVAIVVIIRRWAAGEGYRRASKIR